MTINAETHPALAAIAAGRDHINTVEFARATDRAVQTISKYYCLTGECFGIRPVKFGNRLLWPVAQVAALLEGGSTRAVIEPSSPPSKNLCIIAVATLADNQGLSR